MTPLDHLRRQLGSRLATDDLHRVLYATDASVYRVKPLGVAWPRYDEDVEALIAFAREEGVPLIPRTAGTSLAGQVVGRGLILDFSRYMTGIGEVDPEHKTVTVQPGVIRDRLNQVLHAHGLFFGPNTSTSNRCMIGGMAGNNSCGSTSIRYGSTRDRLQALDVWLSDGSRATFEAMDEARLRAREVAPTLEGAIYRQLRESLSSPELRDEIARQFPKPSIHRRNTGYALDLLAACQPFAPDGPALNMCKLLAGSEGTLAITRQLTLHLAPLPPPGVALVCAHFHTMRAMTEAVLIAMQHTLYACELMDKTVLDCTRASRDLQANRFFLQGDPAAVLLLECRGDSHAEALHHARQLADDLTQPGGAYACPIVEPPHIDKVWHLRAAGLGVLANLPGDPKAVACIEDTAVALEDLPDYIDDLQALIAGYGQKATFFAHAGAGEIHVRPILDLKKGSDRQQFADITRDVALLVKKYRGSFSGEHGDGRLRGGFLPLLFGEKVYQAFVDLKNTWDPEGILNPGKIVGAPPIVSDLRYEEDQATRTFDTAYSFEQEGGLLRMAERCNGSGDCRKSHHSGGTMCPSYHATLDEKHTTRARANTLREYLTHSTLPHPFEEPALAEVMDLCMSCKGCTRECPSGVDLSLLKSEYQYQLHRRKGPSLRTRFFGRMPLLADIAAYTPRLANMLLRSPLQKAMTDFLGVHSARTLPAFNTRRFRQWIRREGSRLPVRGPQRGAVWLFVDEFTEHFDLDVGIAAFRLLKNLGYDVYTTAHPESGRAAISKGLLDHARRMAVRNVATFTPLANAETPLIGLEPSAILGFRDEYLRLVPDSLRQDAEQIASHTYLLEEFLFREAQAGRIESSDFDEHPRHIVLHGHCHQKALSEQGQAAFLLGLPTGHRVEVLSSGCCGMAGSFGYEREHYDVSMRIGELQLFPALRNLPDEVLIAASGHSCRHQIADGIGRRARHVAEVLVEAFHEA
jgi:FAD/FMN-containing dehydrogenase/Fe-S oxidoreductase